jgi:hypothetical protein
VARIPDLRNDPKTKEAILFLKKKVAIASLKKATPITPDQMVKLLASASPKTATTALIMWISAARHSDLKAAWLEQCFGKGTSMVACLRFGPWKSDPTGFRQATKALPTNAEMVKMFKSKDFAHYSAMRRRLYATSPDLTVHSIRRGAIQFLAHNYSPLQIAAITQHAAGQEKSAVHKYTPATMMGPSPRYNCSSHPSFGTPCRKRHRGGSTQPPPHPMESPLLQRRSKGRARNRSRSPTATLYRTP